MDNVWYTEVDLEGRVGGLQLPFDLDLCFLILKQTILNQ